MMNSRRTGLDNTFYDRRDGVAHFYKCTLLFFLLFQLLELLFSDIKHVSYILMSKTF